MPKAAPSSWRRRGGRWRVSAGLRVPEHPPAARLRACACVFGVPRATRWSPGRTQVQRPDIRVERTGRVGAVAGGRVDVAVEDVNAGARSQLDQHVDDALARIVRSGLEHGGPSVGVTSHHDLQTSPKPGHETLCRMGGRVVWSVLNMPPQRSGNALRPGDLVSRGQTRTHGPRAPPHQPTTQQHRPDNPRRKPASRRRAGTEPTPAGRPRWVTTTAPNQPGFEPGGPRSGPSGAGAWGESPTGTAGSVTRARGKRPLANADSACARWCSGAVRRERYACAQARAYVAVKLGVWNQLFMLPKRAYRLGSDGPAVAWKCPRRGSCGRSGSQWSVASVWLMSGLS